MLAIDCGCRGSYGLQATPGAHAAMKYGITAARGDRLLKAMRDTDVTNQVAALNRQSAARLPREGESEGESESERQRELNRFASMAQTSGAASFDLRELRQIQDARELAEYKTARAIRRFST